jgi:membrane protease YdiL (CAAX protease family)
MPSSGSVLRTPAGRFRTPLRLLIAVVFFTAVSSATLVVFDAAGVSVDPGNAAGPALAGVLVALTLDGVVLSVAVLVASRYLGRRGLGDVGISLDDEWWRDLAVGAGLGAALVGGAYVVGVGVGAYEATFDPGGPGGRSLATWLALVAATMVAVAVYEELLLRGYLLTNLAEGFAAVADRRVAVGAALAVSSAAFGLLHGVNPAATRLGLLTITLAGALLGLGYVCTGRLALPVGLHATWNLTHVLLGLPVSGLEVGVRLVATEPLGAEVVHGGAFGPEGGVLGLAATLVGAVAVVGYARLTGRGFRTDVAAAPPRE